MRRATVLLALLVPAVLASPEEEPDYRIVDLVPAFAAYEEACREAGDEDRAAKWDEMLVAPHRAFFDDVLYRGKTGADRDRIATACRDLFWREVAPRVPEIARRQANVVAEVERVVTDFRRVFPGFDPATDFYLTVSFGFRGKVANAGGRRVLALGLERIDPEGHELEITIAHELFHLHHFRFFPRGGGLYRDLWTEGMAVYASALVVPELRASDYLGFTTERMNRCRELLPELAADLRQHLGENDHRLRRIYFGAEENDTRVPPEAGYYVGLFLVMDLAKERPMTELARLTPEEVLPILSAALARMAER